MIRYTNNGVMITFDLGRTNNYERNKKYKDYLAEVIYSYNFNSDLYDISIRLRRRDIAETYQLNITDADEIEQFKSTKENIKVDLSKYIEQKMDDGFFDKYIERFEYLVKCFEIGLDVLETKNE